MTATTNRVLIRTGGPNGTETSYDGVFNVEQTERDGTPGVLLERKTGLLNSDVTTEFVPHGRILGVYDAVQLDEQLPDDEFDRWNDAV